MKLFFIFSLSTILYLSSASPASADALGCGNNSISINQQGDVSLTIPLGSTFEVPDVDYQISVNGTVVATTPNSANDTVQATIPNATAQTLGLTSAGSFSYSVNSVANACGLPPIYTESCNCGGELEITEARAAAIAGQGTVGVQTGELTRRSCTSADETYVAIVNRCVKVNEFASLVINSFIIFGVLAAIYRYASGFFLLTAAQGDPSKLEAGREALTQATVGLLIVVSAYALIQFLQNVLPQEWLIRFLGGAVAPSLIP